MLLQRRKPWPIILSSLGLAWAGCSPAAPRADPPPPSQEAAATRRESAAVAPRESPSVVEPNERSADLATAVSVLSARLLPSLTEREQNVALSALGLHMALAQLATACRGETCEKFAELLSRPVDANFSSEYEQLLRELRGSPGLRLLLRLDVSSSIQPTEAWAEAQQRLFGSRIEKQDFQTDARGATARIDAWFRDETGGRIPSLWGGLVLPQHTQVLSSSVVTFNAPWEHAFSPLETHLRAFRLADGSTVSTAFLHAKHMPLLVGRIEHPGATIASGGEEDTSASMPSPLWVGLPFSGGSMMLLLGLPSSTETLPLLEAQLAEIGVLPLMRRMTRSNLELYLPKLDWLRPPENLKTALIQAFGEGLLTGLDLSAAGLPSTFDIDAAVQRVALRWDEWGADVAVATSIGAVGIGLGQPKPIAFDRPFVFALIHTKTGVPLLQGRVMNPRP